MGGYSVPTLKPVANNVYTNCISSDLNTINTFLVFAFIDNIALLRLHFVLSVQNNWCNMKLIKTIYWN